jgi:hypothetical protein
MNCVNTDSVVRKGEDDPVAVTGNKGGYNAKLNAF